MGEDNINILQRLYRAIRAGVEYFNTDHQWPQPKVNIVDEPHFLFIVTPHYSGSTALAQILNSCHGACMLQKRGEGRWLVPGMCINDWDPEKTMNWSSIRAVWLKRVQLIRELVQDVEIVIEKTPSNLLRIDQLTRVFPNNTVFAYNRNPFANCASILYRRHNPTTKSGEERIKILKEIASDWLLMSRWIKKWIDEMDLIYFSYEEFCADPARCVSMLAEKLPILRSIDVRKNIKVKDYAPAVLQNHNARQIEKLNQQEIDAIAEILKTEPGLVKFFGYSTDNAMT